MNGIEFYNSLHHALIQRQNISDNEAYTFQGWGHNGELRYNVNNAQIQPTIKSIRLELLVISKYWYDKGKDINYQLLSDNGHDNYCTPAIIRYLLNHYIED
jgi:hypothetical protein